MPDDVTNGEPIEVVLRIGGADATATMTPDGITVRAESRGRLHEVASFPDSFRRRRQELISTGVFAIEGDALVVQRDYTFDSPSGAAMMLLGRTANGWRDWQTLDGVPIDSVRSAPAQVQEQGFERRWYEAHVVRFAADLAATEEGARRQTNFASSADEALALLATLETTRDVQAFASGLQQWAVKPTTLAFNGFSGQMLVNQLVKRTEDSVALADVLADVLRSPSDAADASRKIQRLVDHIETIRVGAHPAPGHAPFLLSYFWSLQDHGAWPTIWASAASFTEFCTGVSLPSVPVDRYEQFRSFIELVDNDYERFERVAVWWDEAKPVFLDPVLVDRCVFGWDPDRVDIDTRFANADALVRVAQHIAASLTSNLSSVLGRSLSAKRPSRLWSADYPRSDFWVDWRAHESGLGLRLWVGKIGASIGLAPGLVRDGWREEVADLCGQSELPGFLMIGGRGKSIDGNPAHGSGQSGEFTFAGFFRPAELAELDVEREVTAVAVALQPLMDELMRRATGEQPPGPDDPLAPSVAEFRALGYPSPADEEQRADRARFAEFLAADTIALADPAELRRIWNTGRYGGPGPQSTLNVSIRDADAAEYDRIIDTFRHICWGEGDDADRIDEVLDPNGHRYVKGLGEAVIMKMLSICHPDRYLPVFPYSGPKGKRRMLQVLDLDEPAGESRGHLQVEANDRLRQRLDHFFPGDPWGMAQFLYRYSEGLDDEEIVSEVDPIEELADELLVDRSFIDDIVALLEDKRQIILYGPPGTGKTYLAQKLAEVLVPDPTRRSLVQFHPSTSYEDFFEGYRPETTADGQLSYRLTQGPLALLASRAAEAPGKRHLMIIDEINRANLPRVLGELLFLLEYRNVQVPTLYRPDDPFELPADLWFIGTMNTADRSIALVDAALRRRFHFVPFFPNRGPMQGLLDRWLAKHGEPPWVGELVSMVNDQLTEALNGPHLQIGPSYFMKSGLDQEAVRRIWEYNIEPFIEDQFFGDPNQIDRFRFESVLAAFLGQVGVGSLSELEAARSGDVGAIAPSAEDVEVGDENE